jgi:hypothetical protein
MAIEWDKLGIALPDEIHAARLRYADRSNNDIEIDDYARRSPSGDAGIWIQAWVYITPDDVSAAKRSSKNDK